MVNKDSSVFVGADLAKFEIETNQELHRRCGKSSELITTNGDKCHIEVINPTHADLIELHQLQPNHRIFAAPTAYTTSAVYLALLLAKGEPMPSRFNGSAAARQLAVN